jgi:TolB protein
MLIKHLSIALALAAATIASHAFAQDAAIRIDTTGSVDTRVPIAVPPFASTSPELAGIAKEMAEVVAFDLDFTDRFIVLASTEYPPGFTGLSAEVTQLDLDMWAMPATRAENLVYGSISLEGGEVVARLRLFDLTSKDQVFGQELRVGRDFARLAAHRFSEEIMRYIEGTQGIGTSEMVFSMGGANGKEIYVSDYDGANAKQVTQHNSISIKPKMSPDGSKIAYLSYKDNYPFLYVYSRSSGQSVRISGEVGLNLSPAWSPDGSKIAMTLSKDGNTEIYVRNADGTNPQRLTRNKYGDTSPAYSPDGSRIAFVSDRAGAPQIYVMPSSGGDGSRLSFQGGSAYDPAWSPDGTKIAYVAERSGEGLEIYVMGADGSNPIRLTNSHGSNESPSWSPDSRHIVFMTTRAGGAEVWFVNPETGIEKRMPNQRGRAEGPSWGPRRR